MTHKRKGLKRAFPSLFSSFLEKTAYRSLLCLNGLLPSRSFFQQLDLPIIAADGAANRLAHLAVRPHLIVGDLDSATAEAQQSVPCLRVADQSRSDFQKALHYLETQQLLPSIVLGVNGGFLDHILCNMAILSKTRCLFYDPPRMIGIFLQEGSYGYLDFPLDTKLSLVGAPHAVVTSRGLRWELKSQELHCFGENSFFNRSLSPAIELEVEQGALLLLVYLQPITDAGALKTASLR